MSTAYDPRPHPGSWAKNRANVRRPWAVPFYYVEWLTRLIAHYLSHWALLEVLEYAGRFTILIAVILYFMEAPDRRKRKHYEAWQVINSAAGKSGNGGRMEAMEELNQDRISLVGVDVSKAFLQGIQLPGADLHFSTMQECDLRGANFQRANFAGADLSRSNLRGADLRGVAAEGANLSDTDLTSADLGAADLTRADLRNADLSDVKWSGIRAIYSANIHGVEHAPPGFVQWAMKNGAVAFEDENGWDAAKGTPRPATKPSGGLHEIRRNRRRKRIILDIYNGVIQDSQYYSKALNRGRQGRGALSFFLRLESVTASIARNARNKEVTTAGPALPRPT